MSRVYYIFCTKPAPSQGVAELDSSDSSVYKMKSILIKYVYAY